MEALLLKYFRKDNTIFIYFLCMIKENFYVANKNYLLACFRKYSNSRRISTHQLMRAVVKMTSKHEGPRVLCRKTVKWGFPSVQFSSVPQSCPTVCNPVDSLMSGLPVYYQLPEFTQTHVHWVSDAIQPSHPLSSPSPPDFNLSQHQGLVKRVSSSHQVSLTELNIERIGSKLIWKWTL